MLKKLAAWVLNNYLGKYVENLNTEQLSFGLLRGEVELENLPLKKDALRLLDGSIEVRAGFLSKIHLKIPVTHLMSEPWVISIEKLYLILGPISPYEYDKERDQEAEHDSKMAELDLIEAAWRSEHEAKQEESYYASSYSSWVSYGTSFVTSIIENLQLNIKDVHVRFEADVFRPNCPFACGITIESLVAQKTNDKWQPQVGFQDYDDAKRKLVNLRNLSIYWHLNSSIIGFLPMPELEETMQKLSSIMYRGDCTDYILEPVSVQARFIQNNNPVILHSRSSPRFVCDLFVDKFPISLREDQYDSMVGWLYDFERLNKMIKYRKWRPHVEVSGHVKEWWRFMAQPFREKHHEKRVKQNWTYVLTRAKHNVLYVKAYAEYLLNPVTCPAALKKHKDEMEQKVPLEELKILCRLAMEKVSVLEKQETEAVKHKTESGVGILQRWFPLWQGWYPAVTLPSAEVSDQPLENPRDAPGALEAERHLEQEILGALASSVQDDCLFRRDAVFAKVNFTLHRAIFSVYSSKYPSCSLPDSPAEDASKKSLLFELVFADVRVGLELRPRSSSTMLVISLGGLYLQDKSLEDSQYPMLIVSQNREVIGAAPTTISSLAGKFPFKFPSFISQFASSNVCHITKSKDPLLHLTYETKPSNSGVNVKLHVKSESLDVVYNVGVLKKIAAFFVKPHKRYHNNHEYGLQSSARYRYEKFKQQTTKEILKNCGHIFDSEQPFTLKNWDIHLDISAPRIIFPENLFDADATVVVCDLGRLQFCTVSNSVDSSIERSTDSDDEDFRTPCSTPPDSVDYSSDVKYNFHPILPVIKEDTSNCDITEEALHNRMYDRYTLDFRDLQILVCDAKNIISYAYVQGTSTMHVLDKFSISLQLERRVIHTLDPQWPGVTLYGTLPKIVVHVTEQKIQALKTCFGQQQSLFDDIWLSHDDSLMHRPHVPLEDKADDTNNCSENGVKEYNAEVRLLMMQFNIGEMCLDVQSRGRSIAELQVMGIKSTFTKRPYDTSVTLTVHSLLIVDALQTFGPDFELLVASHKNISMDSMSGSIRDSEPNSPTSPASPTASRSVCTSPVAINAALKTLQLKTSSLHREASPTFMSSSKASLPPYFLSEKLDTEALISIEFVVVRPHIPTKGDFHNNEVTKIATVQFNTLDVIANQETIVELIGFIKNVLPHDRSSYLGNVSPIDNSIGDGTDVFDKEINSGKNVCVEVTFDFNRLSVLLLRCVDVDGMMSAQKIATATMTGACIHATAGSDLKIQGSLGGLQIFDLVLENAKHSRILSVGYDPLLAYPVSLVDELNAVLYASGSVRNSQSYNVMQAFDFAITISETQNVTQAKTAFLTLKMASVFYIHSSRFLRDVASCVSEFKQYAVKFANSIRTAATEMAIGIVSRRIERAQAPLNSNSVAEGIFSIFTPPSPVKEPHETDNSCHGMDVTFKLDVLLESPVMIFPESSTSSIVLVAHLGRIAIKNDWHNNFENPSFSHARLTTKYQDKMEEISVDIRDINLYSVDVDRNSHVKTKTSKILQPQDYTCTERRFPILHDTVMELTINHYVGSYMLESIQSWSFIKECDTKIDRARNTSVRHIYNVYGCVSKSLKVSLSRKHYNQILKTLDSLSLMQDNAVPSHSHWDTGDLKDWPLNEETAYYSNQDFAIGVVFKLREFSVELLDELRNMERGLVSLSFQDIITKFEKQDYYSSHLEITLKSLIMEDLLQEPNSRYRFLMLSSSPTNLKPVTCQHLSSSCPDVTIPHVVLPSYRSLPDKLNTENVFHNFQRTKEKKMYGGQIHFTRLPSDNSLMDSCPQTPPPSPLHNHQSTDEALVHIRIFFVDDANEEFAKKYNSTSRFVDVNFNSLDIIVNLHSWVHVFDFFGLSTSNYTSSASGASVSPTVVKTSSDRQRALTRDEKMEMEVQVRSLSMMFKKDEYELAKANVSNMECRISKCPNNLSVKGRLGRMSLLDLSPHGCLYKEKFTTIGNEALHFDIMKYGNVSSIKECDASVHLKMFSVFYIHSKRFYDEVMAFFQHFTKLQEIVEKVRAASSGAKVNDLFLQESRVRMSVCVQSCIMVLPVSSWSTEVLVADFGNLTLTNKFRVAGSEDTISIIKKNHNGVFMTSADSFDGVVNQEAKSISNKKSVKSNKENQENCQYENCLLDVINVNLLDIDLYTAERMDRKTTSELNVLEFSSFAIHKKGRSLLTEKCKLNLQVERNLDKEFNHTVANMSVRGTLSAIHGIVNVDQYKIIRGFFSHNLGEQHEEFHAAGVSSLEKGSISEVWITMWLQLDLINVTLEFLDTGPLAKVNFIKSKLTYESASNNTLDVDLVSREILVSDTRFQNWPLDAKPNVFTNILQPTKHSKPDLLQAELHYRVCHDTTRFTILLNNMQLIAILDWWKMVINFLRSKIEIPQKLVSVKTNATKSSLSTKFAISLSSGVATRRAPVLDLQELPFEFKINVTETGIVVVEDSQAWDTNAVILQSTAVVTYCPLNQDKPLSSSFQRLEVFSCVLGLEDETSLSIIDPVTINVDIVSRYNHGYSAGLLDVTDSNICYILEVSTHDFVMRLSYHDIKLFLRIMDTLSLHIPFLSDKKHDVTLKTTEKTSRSAHHMIEQTPMLENHINRLETMGFLRQDCQTALEACKGNLHEAALWLTQHASHASAYYKDNDAGQTQNSSWFALKALEFNATNICMCLIDDCKDSDVPLIEITLSDLNLEQTYGKSEKIGTSRLVMSLDFYNRNFSGWEPLLEPWRCTINWNITNVVNPNLRRVLLEIKSEEIANFNITSSVIDIWGNVKTNWTEDYYKQGSRTGNYSLISDAPAVAQTQNPNKLAHVVSYSTCKRRSPFVPFAIQNLTGCDLKFATITVNSDRIVSMDCESNGAVLLKHDQRWIAVSHGEIVPFEFEGRVKMRHQNTHQLKVHQLIVWIEGWHQIVPVSVDKVGVFFRHAKPQGGVSFGLHSDRHIARVVFAITLEGSAQKLVTVRSALVLINHLESMLDVKLENSDAQLGARTLHLPQRTALPVPLPFVNAKIFARPVDISGVQSYSEPIQWQHVERPGEIQEASYCSLSMSARVNKHDYMFCAQVRRENYPIDETVLKMKSGPSVQPAHVIKFVPPVILVNLLPCELSYELCCFKDARGQINPGGNASIHSVDLSSTFEIRFLFDSFHVMNNLRVPGGSHGFTAVLHATDEKDRKLLLNIKAVGHPGGAALKIYIYAPYWIINKTGLPLIFRQDHAQHEAAGQTVENELARSVAPLPFSFSETEIPEWCSMRVGKSVHPNGEPIWCHYFHLQKGVQVRRLTILSRSSRPDWIYSIGIEIRPGRGKYRDVYFVTLTPRFQLKNHSSHSLEFTQKYAVNHVDLEGVRLSAMPKCVLPFHWPRLDHEQLLCVRLSNVDSCSWSGGFPIDKINSLHINIRDGNDKPIFIRAEIVLQGATFFVVFTDADNMPPPFRLDNTSEVPITCHQSSITEERKRICVRPHTCVPYALDEPTSKPEITCIAPGGSTAIYNLSALGTAKPQLSYENFIYICLTETFPVNDTGIHHIVAHADNYQGRELVLDVPEGLKVVLNTKEPGKRSQLWRMTSTGKLIHEGSRPPQKTKKHAVTSANSDLVLDIADIVALPDKYVSLRLRKADPRRNITQTWEFSEDGRLRCQLNNLYVQSNDGFHGLVADNEVVLGPSQPIIFAVNSNGIPVEQCVSRQRLWPGSGLLGVKIINDGPTRVLSISDLGQKSVVVEEKQSSIYYKSDDEGDLQDRTSSHLQVTVCLLQGVGISLVNSVPEELIYALFKNITVEFIRSPHETSLDGSIQDLQVDNQLREQECPTILFVSPMNKNEHKRHLPAIRFQISRTPSRHANVDIFKYFIVSIKNLSLMIEERLLWTLLQFIGYGDNSQDVDDSTHETQRILKAASIALAKRYYFGTINLSLAQIRLSVSTSSKLSKELISIKRRMGLTLINFEDVFVELAPYSQTHVFETFQLLMDSVIQHYKDKLKSQAAKILGAVDFLGNPLGLVNDVSEGISGFINEGNVGGLLKNVTHGLSNSAVKVTETLSEGLGMVTMDDRHEQTRRKLRTEHRGRGSEQLVAGVKGLGFGLIGGITSIVTQTYNGAYSDGVPGFFSGFGKGLVGTFTKPAVGVLDLATSAASAVRDTSRSNQHILPPKLRLRRVCVGPGGLLPKYSENHSKGQELLYSLNDNDYSETFVALEMLSHGKDGLCALVSSKKVYFLSKEYCIPTTNCVLPVNLSDLCHCKKVNDYIGTKIACYLELTTKVSTTMGNLNLNETQCRKPKVLCDDEATAIKVSQQINYAKGLYEEMVHALVDTDEPTDE